MALHKILYIQVGFGKFGDVYSHTKSMNVVWNLLFDLKGEGNKSLAARGGVV